MHYFIHQSPGKSEKKLLFYLFAALLFASCKKEIVVPPPPTVTPASKPVVQKQAPPQTDHYKKVNGSDIGLIGDGKFDNNSILNQYTLLHKGIRVILTKGTYLIDPVFISNDSIAIEGNGSQIISNTQSGSGNLIEVQGKNVILNNLILDGNTNKSLSNGVEITKTQDVTVNGLTVNNFPNFGIDISYSNNVSVSNCNVSNAFEGIQFWGGDSQFHEGTPLENLSFTGNTVTNVIQGGIWGSMGNHISMSNNTISKCGDVGLDLEGCNNSKIFHNTVSDCVNGCISLFYGCKTISISSNIVNSSTNQNGIRLFTSKYMTSDVQIDSNQVKTDNSIAILIEENTASNVRLSLNSVSGNLTQGFRSIANNNIQLINNSFNLTNSSFAISNEGGSDWKIELNTLNNTTTQSNGSSSGLFIYKSPQQTMINNITSGNKISGFDTPISDNTGGA